MEREAGHLCRRHLWLSERKALSKNLKELQVLGSKHDTIRKGLVYELLSAQDKVLCSYYAQRGGQRHQPRHQGMSLDDLLTKLS